MSERTCCVEGCDTRHDARGYCPAHYRRWQLYGDPLGSKVRAYKKRPRCSIECCDKPNYGHAYCKMHYWRWKRHGDPLWEQTHSLTHPRLCVHCAEQYQPSRKLQRFCSRSCATQFRQSDDYKALAAQDQKKCTKCGEIKSRDHFFRRAEVGDGLVSWCKECHRVITAAINARPDVKLRRRERGLRTKYGMTNREYDQMLATQHHQCLICGRKHGEDGKPLVVDHCHTTGVVRGLLCALCNSAIGYFEEDVDRMVNAISYLGGRQ